MSTYRNVLRQQEMETRSDSIDEDTNTAAKN
jgi:hypothetical protein